MSSNNPEIEQANLAPPSSDEIINAALPEKIEYCRDKDQEMPHTASFDRSPKAKLVAASIGIASLAAAGVIIFGVDQSQKSKIPLEYESTRTTDQEGAQEQHLINEHPYAETLRQDEPVRSILSSLIGARDIAFCNEEINVLDTWVYADTEGGRRGLRNDIAAINEANPSENSCVLSSLRGISNIERHNEEDRIDLTYETLVSDAAGSSIRTYEASLIRQEDTNSWKFDRVTRISSD